MSTVKIGTCTWAKATIHVAPWRIVPCVSCSRPTAKPGLSTRLSDREVEQVAQVEVAGQLVAAVGRHRPAVDVAAVGGDDADRVAVEAGEADDLVGAPQRADLEERAAVGHQLDGPAHVERRRALARDRA